MFNLLIITIKDGLVVLCVLWCLWVFVIYPITYLLHVLSLSLERGHGLKPANRFIENSTKLYFDRVVVVY